MRWHLCFPHALHLQVWGTQAVLYHGLSGDTHLLEAGTAAIIEQLRLAPASTPELTSLFSTDAEPALLAQLDRVLADLARLGVVQAR